MTSLRLLAVLNILFKYACARQAARAFFSARLAPSLHFSPPDGRSTRYDRHDFVALACRARRTVKYACARQAARASS